MQGPLLARSLPMRMATLIKPSLVFPRLDEHDNESVLRFFAEKIAAAEDLDVEEIHRGLLEREKLSSSAIGGGVAIPHCRTKKKCDAILAVGMANDGIPFGAADHLPVRLFFVVVSPKSDPAQNLRFLSAISRWVKVDGNVEKLLEHPSRPAMLELLHQVGEVGDPAT